MKIMQKQEDWNLFDFPKAEKFTQRRSTTRRCCSPRRWASWTSPARPRKLADQSLAMAIDLSEQLATFHGDLLLNRRRAANAFVKHIFGCRVDPQVQNERYQEIAATQFDYAVLPMRWKQLQPQEHAVRHGRHRTTGSRCSASRRVPTIAGPLVRLDHEHVPDWMVIWEHDFDMLREMAYDYVQKVVHALPPGGGGVERRRRRCRPTPPSRSPSSRSSS